MASRQALSGDPIGALRTAASAQQLIERMVSRQPPGSVASLLVALGLQAAQAEVAYERGDLLAASRLAATAIERLRNAKPVGTFQRIQRSVLLYRFSNVDGHAEYALGHFAASERAERLALAQRKILSTLFMDTENQRDEAETSTWPAMALARQGKRREAAESPPGARRCREEPPRC